ncbi:MAG: type I secretion system permease/ATPase [Hyphomicrobium sp.]|nr:type I secretion system permease/ATPase [Hyphomicrobium sp.]
MRKERRDSEGNGIAKEAIRSLRSVFWGVGLISCVLNLLMLTGPVFMLQVYDRVLSSRSIPTLAALSILAGALYIFWGLFEFFRSRTLSRASFWFDERIGLPTFRSWLGRSSLGAYESRPIADIGTVRQFLSSPALSGLFDVPWIPIYLGFVFVAHPWLGWLTVGGALVMTVLALINERATHLPLGHAASSEQAESRFLEQAHRNAESILPMGMAGHIGGHWERLHGESAKLAQQATERGEIFSAVSRAARMILQSAVLGLGAYLAIRQDISPGMIVAVSIVSGRALAPIDQVIGHWRTVVRARHAYQRLNKEVSGRADPTPPLQLPPPEGSLSVRHVTKLAPERAGRGSDSQHAILKDISFSLEPGDALGIIGPSASGKTTLARILIGAWSPDRGEVRLDGALFNHWDRDALGRYIGYLPQTVELLAGTVQQNIARFDPEAKDDEIIAAAKMAGVHAMILNLPEGYETQTGPGSTILSGGQVQRIGLARALFRLPRLVVLDEPNSNLDAEGDAALATAIERLRRANSIVIVMAHRPSAIAAVNKLLMLVNGAVMEFGAKDDVLRKVTRAVPVGAGG